MRESARTNPTQPRFLRIARPEARAGSGWKAENADSYALAGSIDVQTLNSQLAARIARSLHQRDPIGATVPVARLRELQFSLIPARYPALIRLTETSVGEIARHDGSPDVAINTAPSIRNDSLLSSIAWTRARSSATFDQLLAAFRREAFKNARLRPRRGKSPYAEETLGSIMYKPDKLEWSERASERGTGERRKFRAAGKITARIVAAHVPLLNIYYASEL